MRTSQPGRGFFVSMRELSALGVSVTQGERFETDLFDLFRGVYEVVEVTDSGAVVRAVRPSERDAPRARRDSGIRSVVGTDWRVDRVKAS